jgi:hypothetical protein
LSALITVSFIFILFWSHVSGAETCSNMLRYFILTLSIVRDMWLYLTEHGDWASLFVSCLNMDTASSRKVVGFKMYVY